MEKSNGKNSFNATEKLDLYVFYTGFSKFGTKVSFDFHITKHFLCFK